MQTKQGQALERLLQLARKSKSGMPVPDIIEAVVGGDYDEELGVLATLALEANLEGMSLAEIAAGILHIEAWRNENA